MLKKFLLISGIVCLASVGPVFAEEDSAGAEDHALEHAEEPMDGPAWSRPGWYVSLGGSAGIDQAFADELEDLSGESIDVKNSLGFKLKVGRRSNRYLALELELEYLPSFDIEINNVTALETEIFTGTVNVKLFLLNGRIQPYLLIGAGFMSAKVEDTVNLGFSISESGPVARAGGGLDLYLTEHVALAIDISYVLPSRDVTDLDYVSIGWGLQYKF